MRHFFLVIYVLVAPGHLLAGNGYAAWLRYAPIGATIRKHYDALPANAIALGDSAIVKAAQAELIRGVRGILGGTLRAEGSVPNQSAFAGDEAGW